MSLPTDYDERKENFPLWDFMFGYFPDTWLEVVKVAVEGNKQHNPGERLHWARGKSMDQLNTAMRHQFDHGMGTELDSDGCYHLAKAIWRLSAELQLIIEKKRNAAKVAEVLNRQEVPIGGFPLIPGQCECGVGMHYIGCPNR